MQESRHGYMMYRSQWKSRSRIWEKSLSKRGRKREETREKRDGAFLEGRDGGQKGQAFKSIQAFGLATPHPVAAAEQNEQPMAKLRQIFEMTAGADADALLSTPGLTYVVELLRDAGETLKVDDLEQLYAEESWEADRSFTWLELQALQHRIQTAAVNADDAKTTGNTGNSDHQLPADPAEESLGADVKAETSLPRVDVGGAGVEEQTRRRR